MTDMLQKSENVAKNVANENSQDLTELWKKGELPSGLYYVKNEFGNIFPSDYSEDYDCISDTVIKDFFTEVSEIKEVLEPVPSYDDWKALNGNMDSVMQTNQALCKKLAELKERNDSLNNRDINLCRIANGIRDENYKLKNIITEMCCQLVDDDDDMSLGLAEYFDQDLLIEIREALK